MNTPHRRLEWPYASLLVFLLVLLVVSVTACATSEPYQPKKRAFQPGEYAQTTRTSTGGLLALGTQGLIEDDRPTSVGDVIIIRVDENDSASHDASTRLDRESVQNYGIAGALAQKVPSIDLAHALGGSADHEFQGGGTIQRHGRLNATLPVKVQQVLPNGDMFVEGTKTVRVGGEDRHLYVSGIVRRSDVRYDGSVLSSRVADAEIEYTGSGDVSDQESPSWLSRTLGKIWPF